MEFHGDIYEIHFSTAFLTEIALDDKKKKN